MIQLIKSILSELYSFGYNILSFIYWNSKNVRITFSTKVSLKANLQGCSFFGKSIIGEEASVKNFTYGNDVFIQHAEIGEYCSLGPGCKIGLEEHDINNYSTHPSQYDFKKFVDKKGKAIIGNHVWIGANVIILQGVKIGNHSVIAAGAVVNKNISDYEIWGGIPAKFISARKIN
jgi:acetyltransferase-like isoleucine patch superfamily enzyme